MRFSQQLERAFGISADFKREPAAVLSAFGSAEARATFCSGPDFPRFAPSNYKINATTDFDRQ